MSIDYNRCVQSVAGSKRRVVNFGFTSTGD
jgi:hypothetical protein